MGEICSKCFRYVSGLESGAFEPGKNDGRRSQKDGLIDVLKIKKFEESNQNYRQTDFHNEQHEDENEKEHRSLTEQENGRHEKENGEKYRVLSKTSHEEVIIILSGPEEDKNSTRGDETDMGKTDSSRAGRIIDDREGFAEILDEYSVKEKEQIDAEKELGKYDSNTVECVVNTAASNEEDLNTSCDVMDDKFQAMENKQNADSFHEYSEKEASGSCLNEPDAAILNFSNSYSKSVIEVAMSSLPRFVGTNGEACVARRLQVPKEPGDTFAFADKSINSFAANMASEILQYCIHKVSPLDPSNKDLPVNCFPTLEASKASEYDATTEISLFGQDTRNIASDRDNATQDHIPGINVQSNSKYSVTIEDKIVEYLVQQVIKNAVSDVCRVDYSVPGSNDGYFEMCREPEGVTVVRDETEISTESEQCFHSELVKQNTRGNGKGDLYGHSLSPKENDLINNFGNQISSRIIFDVLGTR